MSSEFSPWDSPTSPLLQTSVGQIYFWQFSIRIPSSTFNKIVNCIAGRGVNIDWNGNPVAHGRSSREDLRLMILGKIEWANM